MIKIYLARHGETTWNAEGKVQGRSDPDLSPKGYAQSLILLERVKDRPLSAIYTSTLKRSILTAQPIAQYLGLSVQKQAELDEIAFGIFEGVKFSEVDGRLRLEWERFKENRLTYHIPGAENYTDVANRVRPFKERILRDHQNQEILIVAHRGVNRMLLGLLLEFSLEEALKIEQTNECLYLIERNGALKVSYDMDGETREGLLLVGQNAIL
ncbi:MAG TPA: histidine phosphatase family protein [Thermodesulfobacteriota bacterium]|nr:histidine phosphatase family protein [Thermodesulfobacteriota bacterium]